MLCERCGKNEAKTHIKRTINGQTNEHHLCQECAGEIGYGNIFKSIGINDMISSFFGDTLPLTAITGEVKRCPRCGMTFAEIVKTGCCGCAECYTEFYDKLTPSLQRLHGRAQHIGKLSSAASPRARRQATIDKKKRDLERAVAEQRYEDAASLRDSINELEKENGGQ